VSGSGGSPVGSLVVLVVVALAVLWVLRVIVGMLLWGATLLAVVIAGIGALAVMARSGRG
jgi:hypothetical protein